MSEVPLVTITEHIKYKSQKDLTYKGASHFGLYTKPDHEVHHQDTPANELPDNIKLKLARVESLESVGNCQSIKGLKNNLINGVFSDFTSNIWPKKYNYSHYNDDDIEMHWLSILPKGDDAQNNSTQNNLTHNTLN